MKDLPEVWPTGIDEDGRPLAFPARSLVEGLRKHGAPAPGEEAVTKHERAGYESLGLPFDVDAADLSRAGWGAVFADDVPPEVRDALQPLIEHREHRARKRFKTLRYQPGESVREFLLRHDVSFGRMRPSRVPYHLMLVGSPASMSFDFQYLLDLEYSVGRVWFDDVAGFAHYARSVVRHETAKAAAAARQREVVYFAPRHADDPATRLMTTQLVAPLRDGTDDDPAVAGVLGFRSSALVGADATKPAFLELLRGATNRPALLFAACHGLACAAGAPHQPERQGALITAEWIHGKPVTPDMRVTAADVPADAQLDGLVAFVFACYGAGTPATDQFSETLREPPRPIASRPFVAALPQRLLGGGALAVIGHVERAWGHSLQQSDGSPEILPFRNAVARILEGHCVGEAIDDLSLRYANLSTELVGLLAPTAPPIDDATLVARWLEQTDARNYVLLGDPAARLRAAELT